MWECAVAIARTISEVLRNRWVVGLMNTGSGYRTVDAPKKAIWLVGRRLLELRYGRLNLEADELGSWC